MTGYYDEYAAIARRAGAGLMLESATWRANPDWGAWRGYSPRDLDRMNRAAITMLGELRERYRAALADVVISGMIGPRGDGYQPGEEWSRTRRPITTRPRSRRSPRPVPTSSPAYTLTGIGEAIGIALPPAPPACRWPSPSPRKPTAGSPAVSRWPRRSRGSTLRPRRRTSRSTAPTRSTWPRPWPSRAPGTSGSRLRYNASTRSHAELDEADDLDEGDIGLLADGHRRQLPALAGLTILGGCCGTDARHVDALWN